MRLTVQKRLAAQILDCSEKKVWIDPERLEDVKEAITKQDLFGLIKQGLIMKKKLPWHSRGRSRILKLQKKKGRRKGMGNRKGRFTVRNPPKKKWMANVRAQRSLLRELRGKGLIEKRICSSLIRRVKGGFFRSRRHIKLYLSEHRLIKAKGPKIEEPEKAKSIEKKPAAKKPAEKK
jgi:large subunit ribosomal protein L19e